MVTSIARQSVIIKCNQQTSVLLGNYEFYYLAGLMKKFFGFQLSEDFEPEKMKEEILRQLPQAEAKNPQEAYLIELVKNYRPLEEHNEQTAELFRWGEGEAFPWQVNIPAKR